MKSGRPSKKRCHAMTVHHASRLRCHCSQSPNIRPWRATLARCRRHRAGIILLNCTNSENCNKKEKTPLHDHLEYLLVQNPLSEQHNVRT